MLQRRECFGTTPGLQRVIERTRQVAENLIRAHGDAIAPYVLTDSTLFRPVLVDPVAHHSYVLMTDEADLLLGSGGCKRIYFAIDETGRKWAVAKITKKEDPDANRLIATEKKYARCLQGIASTVQTQCFAENETDVYFIQEYGDQGDLVDAIRESVLTRVSFENKLRLIHDLCEAVAALHSAGIIHRDLKPANALLFLQQGLLRLKIIDWDLAVDETDEAARSKFGGTIDYMAPELVANRLVPSTYKLLNTKKGDSWSVGLIILQILWEKLLPWQRDDGTAGENSIQKLSAYYTNPERFKEYNEVFLRIVRLGGIDSRLIKLVFQLIHLDPEKRPTAEAAFEQIHAICVECGLFSQEDGKKAASE